MCVGLHILIWPAVTSKIVDVARQHQKHLPHAVSDFVGWRDYGRAMARNWPGPLIYYPVANRAQDAAEASFYMPQQPEVWCIGLGYRPTSFDYFDPQPDFTKIPGVMWIGTSVNNLKLFESQYHYEETRRDSLFFPRFGSDREYLISFLEHPHEATH